LEWIGFLCVSDFWCEEQINGNVVVVLEVERSLLSFFNSSVLRQPNIYKFGGEFREQRILASSEDRIIKSQHQFPLFLFLMESMNNDARGSSPLFLSCLKGN
jgi:hypothetical protein